MLNNLSPLNANVETICVSCPGAGVTERSSHQVPDGPAWGGACPGRRRGGELGCQPGNQVGAAGEGVKRASASPLPGLPFDRSRQTAALQGCTEDPRRPVCTCQDVVLGAWPPSQPSFQ